MDVQNPIRQGSRVYLKLAVCGEPGMVMGFSDNGKALVDWIDMPEIGRFMEHDPDSLIVDEAFRVEQLDIAFSEQAA